MELEPGHQLQIPVLHLLALILSTRAMQRKSSSSRLLWAGGLESMHPWEFVSQRCIGKEPLGLWTGRGFEKLISSSHQGRCLLPKPGGGVPKPEDRLPGEEKSLGSSREAVKVSSCDHRMVGGGACLARRAGGAFLDLGSSPASKLPADSQQVPAHSGLSFHTHTTIISSPLQSEIPYLKPSALWSGLVIAALASCLVAVEGREMSMFSGENPETKAEK